MRSRPWRRGVPVVLILSMLLSGAPVARGEPPVPSLRLFATKESVTREQSRGGRVFLNLGVWVTPVHGAFELWVQRPDYATPFGIVQVDGDTREVVRELPADVLDEWWSGLAGFGRVRIFDAQGRRVFRRVTTLCPNNWSVSRVDDTGPIEPRYPYECWAHPYFAMGTVWGLDEGWAVAATGEDGYFSLKLAEGTYTVNVNIRREYAELFEIPLQDARVSIELTVVPKKKGGGTKPPAAPEERVEPTPHGPVPEVTDPDPATLPDLRSTPAWGFGVSHRKGRDYVAFAANEWNAGPGPLVVEGFRRPNEDVMDAYQYFYRDGQPEGRAPAGTLEYHAERGHRHWHFEQFTRYTLLDAAKMEAVASGKQSWCLVETDALDLTVEGASWRPGSGLSRACGWEDSIWVRETLAAGWGDTYYQAGRAQGFDVTDLPNGRYYVQVEVNPQGLLYERDTGNNASLRLIRLKGKPGKRRVVAPPHEGIDTEGGGGFFDVVV